MPLPVSLHEDFWRTAESRYLGMIMSLSKKLHLVILLCALSGISAPISAHVLNETTAQVILRDGQIEVRLTTGIDHLIATLQNDQAWLLGDIDAVMPVDLSAEKQADFIKNALEQKTSLMVNGKAISFERVAFYKNPISHDGELVFQAKHQFPEVKDVSVSFHKILGPVHASFVKPKYQVLGAGEAAKITF